MKIKKKCWFFSWLVFSLFSLVQTASLGSYLGGKQIHIFTFLSGSLHSLVDTWGLIGIIFLSQGNFLNIRFCLSENIFIFIFLLRTIFLLSGDKSPPVLCIRKTVYFILVLEGYFYWYETLGDYTLSLQLSCMRFIELPEYLDSCLPSVLENFQSFLLQIFILFISLFALLLVFPLDICFTICSSPSSWIFHSFFSPNC